MSFIHITHASYAGGYCLSLEFNDGTLGRVDLSEELEGSIFEPLRDMDFFRQFTLNSSTIEWPNGADFAPEYLHSLITDTSHPLAVA
jgi:hypothetical protein